MEKPSFADVSKYIQKHKIAARNIVIALALAIGTKALIIESVNADPAQDNTPAIRLNTHWNTEYLLWPYGIFETRKKYCPPETPKAGKLFWEETVPLVLFPKVDLNPLTITPRGSWGVSGASGSCYNQPY